MSRRLSASSFRSLLHCPHALFLDHHGNPNLKTELGELRAGPSDTAADGGACTVSIRPEAIEVVRAGEGETASGVNRLRAKVVESIYLGEMVQLTLQSGAVKLRANVRQRAADEPIARGTEMMCTIDPRDVVLLSS